MNLRDLALKRVAAKCDDTYCMEWILNVTMNYTTDQLVLVLHRYGCASWRLSADDSHAQI